MWGPKSFTGPIGSLHPLLQRFFEHFAGVLRGDKNLPDENHVQLDAKVCEIETSLNTQGDVVEELTLSEVTDCVKNFVTLLHPVKMASLHLCSTSVLL